MPKLITQLTLEEILAEEKASNLSFNSTTDRPLYPMSICPDRLGNETLPIRGTPETGPGAYNVETGFLKELNDRVGKSESVRGYCLASTGPARVPMVSREHSKYPSPLDYQKIVSHSFPPNYRPFLSGRGRFDRFKEDQIPTVGTYESPVVYTPRTIKKAGTFGGTEYLMTPLRSQKDIGITRNIGDQYFKKFRLREAYLSMYY